jgi:hypothetical protein
VTLFKPHLAGRARSHVSGEVGQEGTSDSVAYRVIEIESQLVGFTYAPVKKMPLIITAAPIVGGG